MLKTTLCYEACLETFWRTRLWVLMMTPFSWSAYSISPCKKKIGYIKSVHLYIKAYFIGTISWKLQTDKVNCTVRFGDCFLRVPLMYQPRCLVPFCQGKLEELTKTAYKTYSTVNFVS